jgi:hypothetical protein
MELRSEFINLTRKEPDLFDPSVAFADARAPLVDWELSEFGATESYIDDIFTVFPFLSEEHLQRGRNAALLAIDTFGRPVCTADPLPRDPIVAEKKVTAEGTPTERIIVLGWQIDTRRMLIQLPEEKAAEWDKELSKMIKTGDDGWPIGVKWLETIQGRDINVAMVVPGAMHFHSRMYGAIDRSKLRPKLKKGARPTTRLTAEERRDLRLHRHLLAVARRGVSLNNIIIREPDHLGRSDAFEGGISGFDLTLGRAWRWAVPIGLQHKKSENFLEYLACMTQLVCMLRDTDWKSGDCFLSVGDNTSALGWIHKSNFKLDKIPEQATHLALARHITLLLADLDGVQCGQWLPGDDNRVADALS